MHQTLQAGCPTSAASERRHPARPRARPAWAGAVPGARARAWSRPATSGRRRPASQDRPPRSARTTRIEVREAGPRWVSRAAYKLVGALEDVRAAGTRGRRAGAASTWAPRPAGSPRCCCTTAPRTWSPSTSGHGQLVPELADDPRVTDLSPDHACAASTAADIGGPVDAARRRPELHLADPGAARRSAALLRDRGDRWCWSSRSSRWAATRLGKGGIVRAQGDRAWAVTEVARAADRRRAAPEGWSRARSEGGEGNAEYLLWLTPARRVDGMGGSGGSADG